MTETFDWGRIAEQTEHFDQDCLSPVGLANATQRAG